MNVRYLTLLAVVLTGQALAGPFGLEKGMTLEQLKKIAAIKEIATYAYRSSTLPNGHPDFDVYTLLVTPQHGLCKVVATSKSIETSVYGTELHRKFESIESSLEKKYGKHTDRFDDVPPGSIWKEPHEFMMGLKLKERDLLTAWTSDGATLPDHLKSIVLKAVAESEQRGSLVIAYEFDNVTDCLNARKSKDDQSL